MVVENLVTADECPSNWVFQHLYRGFAFFVITSALFDRTCVDEILTFWSVNYYIKATVLLEIAFTVPFGTGALASELLGGGAYGTQLL